MELQEMIQKVEQTIRNHRSVQPSPAPLVVCECGAIMDHPGARGWLDWRRHVATEIVVMMEKVDS